MRENIETRDLKVGDKVYDSPNLTGILMEVMEINESTIYFKSCYGDNRKYGVSSNGFIPFFLSNSGFYKEKEETRVDKFNNVITQLKLLNVDGEMMHYILEKTGMEYQMCSQLIKSLPLEYINAELDERFELEKRKTLGFPNF